MPSLLVIVVFFISWTCVASANEPANARQIESFCKAIYERFDYEGNPICRGTINTMALTTDTQAPGAILMIEGWVFLRGDILHVAKGYVLSGDQVELTSALFLSSFFE